MSSQSPTSLSSAKRRKKRLTPSAHLPTSGPESVLSNSDLSSLPAYTLADLPGIHRQRAEQRASEEQADDLPSAAAERDRNHATAHDAFTIIVHSGAETASDCDSRNELLNTSIDSMQPQNTASACKSHANNDDGSICSEHCTDHSVRITRTTPQGQSPTRCQDSFPFTPPAMQRGKGMGKRRRAMSIDMPTKRTKQVPPISSFLGESSLSSRGLARRVHQNCSGTVCDEPRTSASQLSSDVVHNSDSAPPPSPPLGDRQSPANQTSRTPQPMSVNSVRSGTPPVTAPTRQPPISSWLHAVRQVSGLTRSLFSAAPKAAHTLPNSELSNQSAFPLMVVLNQVAAAEPPNVASSHQQTVAATSSRPRSRRWSADLLVRPGKLPQSNIGMPTKGSAVDKDQNVTSSAQVAGSSRLLRDGDMPVATLALSDDRHASSTTNMASPSRPLNDSDASMMASASKQGSNTNISSRGAGPRQEPRDESLSWMGSTPSEGLNTISAAHQTGFSQLSRDRPAPVTASASNEGPSARLPIAATGL